jgi:hypothetical protein
LIWINVHIFAYIRKYYVITIFNIILLPNISGGT